MRVVLLFTRHDQSVIDHLSSRYPEAEIHVYEDRPDTSYISSVRGWLWYKYLSEDPQREQESYFYIDSDIIFREFPDVVKLATDEKVWVGSDCSGYLDHNYLITRRRGSMIVRKFAEMNGITEDIIKETPGAGAQWVIVKPTAAMWLETYNKGNEMWRWLKLVQSDIQKWTAEMWVNLYTMRRFGITVRTDSELDFCTPTDNIKLYDVVKILHNAGVPEHNSITFFKGDYNEKTPFDDDLSFVRRDKASFKYVEAIKEVKL